MAPPLIQLKNIALTFGRTPLLSDAELSVSAGERVCLVGRNGSGKSTLLRIAAGLIESDHGPALSNGCHHSLFATGAGLRRCRDDASLMLEAGWVRATMRIKRAFCWNSSD